MAIEFQRAPVVAVGDELTSGDHNKLAEAFNSRIRSGIGDCAWRILWYLDSATKQVSDTVGDTFELPARDEFLKIFGHYKQTPATTWPDPGVPNQASNPLMKFVYGDPDEVRGSVRIDSEDGRADYVSSLLPFDGITPEGVWVRAKHMRGFVDIAANEYAAPAVTAAQEHFKITPNYLGKNLVSFGGWVPTPLPTGELCGDGIDNVKADTEILDIFFTSLVDGVADLHYKGFCPENATYDGLGGTLSGIFQGPFSYHLHFWDRREPVVLLLSEWIMGPFTGPGRLSHGPSAFIDQTLNRYLSTFRGSEADRARADYDAKRFGFDFQEFLSTQYLMAPSRGTYAAGPPETVADAIINVTSNGPAIAAGTLASGTIAEGYVFGALFLKGVTLTTTATVTVTVGGTVAASVTIAAGSVASYAYNRDGLTGAYVVTLTGAVTTEAGGSLYVEVLELQDYKPGIHDAYLLLRLGSAPGVTADAQLDGDDYASPKGISSDYFTHGMIYNPGSTGLTSINPDMASASAFIESARRVAMDNARIVSGEKSSLDDLHGQQIVKYSVIGGKSVVWFRRYWHDDADADIFRDIAPMTRASGEIQAGVLYDVTIGVLTYNSVSIPVGGQFTGVSGVTAYTGEGTAREADGIRDDAPEQGWSNEWVVVPAWIHGPRNPTEDTIWKEDAFAGPYVAMNNPCLVYSRSIKANSAYNSHYNYGRSVLQAMEAPSGHNYPGGVGASTGVTRELTDADLTRHFTSCQIYQKPYEVESCVMDGLLVKMTFTERFRHHSTAVDEIGDDPTGWNAQLLAEEDYQTDEGRLMKFLLMRAFGTIPLSTYGDAAADGIEDLKRLTDPCAAVIPKWGFLRLNQKAFEDCNDDSDAEDSPLTVESMLQMELYARAMCEGFVDSVTSVSNDCAAGGIQGSRLFDFTFENAMIQAAGVSWFQTLPSAIVGSNVKGFGPLPRTQFYAAMFNQFSNFVNLLTKARIDLPMIFETRTVTTYGYAVATPFYSSGTLPSVGSGDTITPTVPGAAAALWEGTAPTEGYSEVTTAWATVVPNASGQVAFQANKSSKLSEDVWVANGADYTWAAAGFSVSPEWKFSEASPALAAMSADLLALVNLGVGILCQQVDTSAILVQWTEDVTGELVSSCGATPFPNGAIYVRDGAQTTLDPVCFIATSGAVTAPDVVSSRSWVQLLGSDPLVKCAGGGNSTGRLLTLAGGVDTNNRPIVGQGNVFVTIPVVDNDPCDA